MSPLEQLKAKAAAQAAVTDAPTPAASKKRTFVSNTAGSGTILPDGMRITFYGKPGGLGYYETDKPDELDWLEGLAKSATSQINELVNDAVVRQKLVDPAIAQAVEDAKANSALMLDPIANSAVENLGKHIAATATSSTGE